MPIGFEFEPDHQEPPATPSERALREAEKFAEAPAKENSVVIKLWSGGHLSFNPNSHAPIFSIVALLAILIAALLLAFIGIWAPADSEWMEKLTSALGYGVTGIIGAMVGSAAATKDKDEK